MHLALGDVEESSFPTILTFKLKVSLAKPVIDGLERFGALVGIVSGVKQLGTLSYDTLE
jgi:hypothetical protein